MPIQKPLNHLSAYPHLHQHAKNRANSSTPSVDTANSRILQFELLHALLTIPRHNIFRWSFSFPKFVKKSGQSINSFLRHCQFVNAAIWLAKGILAYKLGTWIFLDMRFALPILHYQPNPDKNNFKKTYHNMWPFWAHFVHFRENWNRSEKSVFTCFFNSVLGRYHCANF